MNDSVGKNERPSVGKKAASPYLRTLRNMLIAFLCCAVTFSLGLVLAYCIPTSLMENNLRESAKTLTDEGLQYSMLPDDPAWRMDNFTTTIMLNEAGHGDSNPLRSAFQNPYYKGGQDHLDMFVKGIDVRDGEGEWELYSRYWHGYLVLLKPMLMVFNLRQMRMILLVGLVLALIYVASEIFKREGLFACAAFVVPFAAMNVVPLCYSLSLAWCPWISVASCAFVLRMTKRRDDEAVADGLTWIVPFFVIGGITSYFDFFCAPIMTLGIPLALLIFLLRRRYAPHALRPLLMTATSALCWFLGYGSLWATKWVLSALFTGEGTVGDALQRIVLRTNTAISLDEGAEKIGVFDGLTLNFEDAFPRWALLILAVLLIGVAIYAIVNRQKHEKALGTWVFALAFIGLIPYVWYLTTVNHCYIHHWYTFRNQMPTLLSILLVAASLLPRQNASSQ